jgi:2-methylfumaryl-CoA isomerase
MTYDLLTGLRIIEVSAFVAAPLAGLTLSQLGAEVIRIDPPGGGMDHGRWPLAPDGSSLYWAGLNRTKKSVTLDLRQPDGQSALHTLLSTGGAQGGILLTNLSGTGGLNWKTLSAQRPDLIMVELTGHHDGKPAVDYTVNAAVGFPMATGPVSTKGPINHVLPAWDAIAGLTLATAILAAVHARTRTGKGQHLSIALSDVAYALVSNLGIMAETELSGQSRPRIGNSLFGAFGIDLPTRDDRHVMVVAITGRQWRSLVTATDSAGAMTQLALAGGHDLDTDAGRYAAREDIGTILTTWSLQHGFAEVTATLDRHGVLWGPYQDFAQMMAEDPRATTANPMIRVLDDPALGPLRVAGSPIRDRLGREGPASPAPVLGADTEQVLRDSGLSARPRPNPKT